MTVPHSTEESMGRIKATRILTLDDRVPIDYAKALLDHKLLERTGWDILDKQSLEDLGFITQKGKNLADLDVNAAELGWFNGHKSLERSSLVSAIIGKGTPMNIDYFQRTLKA